MEKSLPSATHKTSLPPHWGLLTASLVLLVLMGFAGYMINGGPVSSLPETTFPPPPELPAVGASTRLKTRILHLGKKESLNDVLRRAKVDEGDIDRVVSMLRRQVDLSSLSQGDQVAVVLRVSSPSSRSFLQALSVAANTQRDISVRRNGEGRFVLSGAKRTLTKQLSRLDHPLKSLLHLAADGDMEEGTYIPSALSRKLASIFRLSPLHNLRPRLGDFISILFVQDQDRNGLVAHYGNIKAIHLTLRGQSHSFYRFKNTLGHVGYYDASGKALPEYLFRQRPIAKEGSYISSHFGRRFHPILKYVRLHAGVDYASSRGSLVYAVSDGVVEHARRLGGYGRYVTLRHTRHYETAYGHLSRFLVKRGEHVKAGQPIGRVGSTGLSTGPHLHYEVLKDGKRVDPLRQHPLRKELLKGKDLSSLQLLVHKIDEQYVSLPHAQLNIVIAQAGGRKAIPPRSLRSRE